MFVLIVSGWKRGEKLAYYNALHHNQGAPFFLSCQSCSACLCSKEWASSLCLPLPTMTTQSSLPLTLRPPALSFHPLSVAPSISPLLSPPAVFCIHPPAYLGGSLVRLPVHLSPQKRTFSYATMAEADCIVRQTMVLLARTSFSALSPHTSCRGVSHIVGAVCLFGEHHHCMCLPSMQCWEKKKDQCGHGPPGNR